MWFYRSMKLEEKKEVTVKPSAKHPWYMANTDLFRDMRAKRSRAYREYLKHGKAKRQWITKQN